MQLETFQWDDKGCTCRFYRMQCCFPPTLNLGRVKPKFMLLREMGYYFHIFSMSIEIKLIAA